jgi:hypothetical protein
VPNIGDWPSSVTKTSAAWSRSDENVSPETHATPCFQTLTCWNARCYDDGMKHILIVLGFLTLTSCVRKVEVRAPEFVRSERYSYMKDGEGRFYVLTVNAKDLDEAMKDIKPGPASLDKLDLWVITPLVEPKKQSGH